MENLSYDTIKFNWKPNRKLLHALFIVGLRREKEEDNRKEKKLEKFSRWLCIIQVVDDDEWLSILLASSLRLRWLLMNFFLDTFSHCNSFCNKFFQAPPEGFASNLYAWFVDEHRLEASDVQVLVDDHDVLLPTTDCYDPREVGCYCCPF